jgi:predicted metal-dependent HD superfamily phosphohydrolase
VSRFACRRAPLAVPAAIEAALAAAYGEPHRAYHDARHIGEVLAWFDVVADAPGPGWAAPAEVFLAILFHDAVYDPLRKDSEARSAAWARDAIARTPAWAAVDADRVAALIELTARHGGLRPDDVAGDRDAAHFLDSDLAIVAAAPERYDAYERAIAIEYAAVPAPAFRDGRRAFLARLAGPPRLFLSDFFHERLDAAARANLTRALATANS